MQTLGALPELGREEKTMYWLIIGEGKEKYALNVGKKSYEKVTKYNPPQLLVKPLLIS